MNKKLIIGLFIAAAAVFYILCSGGTYYYTCIDNSRIEQTGSIGGVITFKGGMEYSYTLPAFDETGAEKDITFGTSRELREGAFIRLTVMPVRGVVEWCEVQYDELPPSVQQKIPLSEKTGETSYLSKRFFTSNVASSSKSCGL